MNRRSLAILGLIVGALSTRVTLAATEVEVCVDVQVRLPEVVPAKVEPAPIAVVQLPQERQAPKEQDDPRIEAATSENEKSEGLNASTREQPKSSQLLARIDQVAAQVSESAKNSDVSSPRDESASVTRRGDPRSESGAVLPMGQTPSAYLRRLMEHFVTHERGFVAGTSNCSQRITVELYPLKSGWTAFARYSGTGREERVDQLLPTELSQFAERAVLSLLHDVPIGLTVNRDNVLWADSLKSTERIQGRGHLVLGVGTRVRGGSFDTLVNEGGDGSPDGVMRKLRLFTPMALDLGYRGQFDRFSVEVLGELDLGTGLRSVAQNPSGGHIDYGGSAGVVLHVLRYGNPRGLTSPYLGAGANFALHWFYAVKPEELRAKEARSTLFGGGLDIDLVAGYEFMRASALSFFLQGELNIPAYVISHENRDGKVNTWYPGAALRLGAIF